jgi:lipoprotein NlpI
MKTLALFIVVISPFAAAAEDAKELLDQARAAYQKRDYDAALKLTEQALQVSPGDAEGHFLRGNILMVQRKFEPAVATFTETLKWAPRFAPAHEQRGTAYFKLGKIKESVADYDEQIKLKPEAGPAHWRRGLALYYAKRYADGVEQFTSSDKQEPNDVENAIWHFLCNARVKGLEKARTEILAVKEDSRGDYMMKIYQMFKGSAKPEEVLAIADAGAVGDEARRRRRFYAHYYLGMYDEAIGESKKSLKEIKTAAEEYSISDYMSDVARVHLQLREAMP